jgi:hypothetical protein
MRRAARTRSGTSGSLLTPGLPPSAPNIGTLLDLVRACAALGELVTNCGVKEVFLHLYAEDRLIQIDRSDRLLFEIDYIYLGHLFLREP